MVNSITHYRLACPPAEQLRMVLSPLFENLTCNWDIKPRRVLISCLQFTALHIDEVFTILQSSNASSTMQFFKSTVIAILAFSAYAAACGEAANSCNMDEPCCPGFACNEAYQMVSMNAKLWDARINTPSGSVSLSLCNLKAILSWLGNIGRESTRFSGFDSTLNIG
jgi:hypothetical protein